MHHDSTTIPDRPLIPMRGLSAVAAVLWDGGHRLPTIDRALAAIQADGCLAGIGLDVETEAEAEAALVASYPPISFDDPRWGAIEDPEDDDLIVAPICGGSPAADDLGDEWDNTGVWPAITTAEPFDPTPDDDLAAALAFPREKTAADRADDRAAVADFFRTNRGE